MSPQAHEWAVERVKGYAISHPYVAHDPACPPGPHPTRNCGCQVFRTRDQAAEYVTERQAATR